MRLTLKEVVGYDAHHTDVLLIEEYEDGTSIIYVAKSNIYHDQEAGTRYQCNRHAVTEYEAPEEDGRVSGTLTYKPTELRVHRVGSYCPQCGKVFSVNNKGMYVYIPVYDGDYKNGTNCVVTNGREVMVTCSLKKVNDAMKNGINQEDASPMESVVIDAQGRERVWVELPKEKSLWKFLDVEGGTIRPYMEDLVASYGEQKVVIEHNGYQVLKLSDGNYGVGEKDGFINEIFGTLIDAVDEINGLYMFAVDHYDEENTKTTTWYLLKEKNIGDSYVPVIESYLYKIPSPEVIESSTWTKWEGRHCPYEKAEEFEESIRNKGSVNEPDKL